MRRSGILPGIIVAVLLATIGSATADQDNHRRKFRAELKGFEEIPTLSTPGSGSFEGKLSNDGASVEWTLEYDNTETDVTQAHIHLGAPAFNGGIMVFLCSNLPSPPPGTAACPPTGGTVSGTFTAADVIGPDAQGIAPGQFEEVIRAIRAGAAYANVHTVDRPGGEIRGQINH